MKKRGWSGDGYYCNARFVVTVVNHTYNPVRLNKYKEADGRGWWNEDWQRRRGCGGRGSEATGQVGLHVLTYLRTELNISVMIDCIIVIMLLLNYLM